MSLISLKADNGELSAREITFLRPICKRVRDTNLSELDLNYRRTYLTTENLANGFYTELHLLITRTTNNTADLFHQISTSVGSSLSGSSFHSGLYGIRYDYPDLEYRQTQ